MSRLSALKEFSFMKALHEVGYPTPEPLGHTRHLVCMSLIRGVPLYQIRTQWEVSEEQAESIFEQSKELAARLAKHGLVHCDLNEFNLMVDLSGVQHELNPGEVVGGHYVRDSGVQKKGEGALSSNDIMAAEVDGTGEKIQEEERVKPKQLLRDGTPRALL